MDRNLTLPSQRLTVAAQLAATVLFDGETGYGLTACDVGCDHAKLSVYLIQSGICKSVVACDINEGPVNKAKDTVSKRRFLSENMDKYITVLKNDGLCGFDGLHFDRVFILGMGGELIANIIKNAPVSIGKSKNTAFLVQAMTSEYDLRKFLYGNGYNILKEVQVADKSRIYSVMLCIYDGEERQFPEFIYHIGNSNIGNKSSLFLQYIDRKIGIQKKLIIKLNKASLNSENAEELLNDFENARKLSCNTDWSENGGNS